MPKIIEIGENGEDLKQNKCSIFSDFPIYFPIFYHDFTMIPVIFRENTPYGRGHCEPTVWNWEVGDHILKNTWLGLSAEKRLKILKF